MATENKVMTAGAWVKHAMKEEVSTYVQMLMERYANYYCEAMTEQANSTARNEPQVTDRPITPAPIYNLTIKYIQDGQERELRLQSESKITSANEVLREAHGDGD